MKTLLVANRGEIALRIMRTATALGIRTVAIHTASDRDGLHVRAADDAVEVSSYLDIDAIAGAAVEVGADAIHPGYGFLSERSTFARAIEGTEGVVLVGPSADVMDKMGKKDAAREVAISAGVPVVPSYSTDADPSTYAYPVLVKAAAGGGGKGMRIVREKGEYAAALAAAKREALTAFGDDTILIEKYVERGRHIEVQVFADAHGNVVHLFERDCSTQRRHQKVLEEAPAPTITEAQRRLVTTSAVDLTKAVGYANAGTVEFLLDSDTGEVYFLEMNTRLQVEHPVTEEIIRVRGQRIDLVELQLRIADLEPLGFDQGDVTCEGHAIEARVYAEDPHRGFLPQAGRATHVAWPEGEGVRVDHALESGQVVSTAFDPMLGKVIATGVDREDARRRLVRALERTEIAGLTTNTGFLRVLAETAVFRDATIDTAWLDRHEVPAPDDAEARLLAASALVPARVDGPWQADGWRSGADPTPVRVALGTELVDVPDTWPPGLPPGFTAVTSGTVEVVHRGQRFVFERPDAFGDHGPAVGDGTLVAPMPGTVLDVLVTLGQEVAEGETLGAMEAMKMELALKAPFAGTVTEVNVAAGQQVALGATLIVVESDE